MLQWNGSSITTTLDYIVQYISTNNFDLLSLQSLNCQPQKLPHLEGYYHPPVCGPTSPDGRVMVCIYVKLHMNVSIVADTAGPANGYTCAVRVRVKVNPDVTIVNCYTPTPCTSFEWLSGLGGKGGCVVTKSAKNTRTYTHTHAQPSPHPSSPPPPPPPTPAQRHTCL